jgi:hypothetical protein
MRLEYLAARWLKWEKQCQLVMYERSPGQPDVIGVNKNRFLLEVEVKRSMSDFRANQKKLHFLNRFSSNVELSDLYTRKAPKQFWFMVPENLVSKIEKELPEFAGLMTADSRTAVVVKPSPTNHLSEKLTIKECVKLMNCAGNQMISLMHSVDSIRERWMCSDPHFMDDFYYNDLPRHGGPSYQNFQI